jgi:hypothetical protein
MSALARLPMGQPAIVAPSAGRDASLHRRRCEALVVDVGAHHNFAVTEVDRSARHVHADVGAGLGEQQNLVGEALNDRDGARQYVVIDDDHLRCIRGLGARFGDDRDDRLADVSNRVRRKGRPRERRWQERDVEREWAEIDVGSSEYPQHAGQTNGLGDVDVDDPRVRHLRTNVDHVHGTRNVQVVDECPVAGQQCRIFRANDSLADHAHSCYPSVASTRANAESNDLDSGP